MEFINKIGFAANLAFMSWEPEKVLDALSTIGYNAVGWTQAHFDPLKKSKDDLIRLVKSTEASGMQIAEIKAPQSFVSLDNEEYRNAIDFTKKVIELAAETGISTVNLFTGPAFWDKSAPVVGEDISEGKAWKMVLDAYEEIVPLAEKGNVHLAIEGCVGMLAHDFYTTKYLIDKLDSKYLGVNLDPSHGILYGNMDVEWIVKEWGNKIKHVHLKDIAGCYGKFGRDFICPMLGEGAVDWDKFLTALAEIKYQGILSVEFESFKYYETMLDGNPVKAADAAYKQVMKLLDRNGLL